MPWEGGSLNRLSDHFALATPGRSVVWEDIAFPQYIVPNNRANPDVLYTLPFIVKRFLYTKSCPTFALNRVANSFARFVAERALRSFRLDLGSEWRVALQRMIVQTVSRYAFDRNHYERLYSRSQPRIVIIEAACYGHQSPAVLVARAMGIPVAEYQHSFITRGFSAYNFAPALTQSSNFRATLPDYFLSYGQWWNDRFDAPVEKIVVGNPHRSEYLARASFASVAVERRDVLVLAKAAEAERYLALARELANLAGSRMRIVFRQKHGDAVPSNRPIVLGPNQVIVDNNADFYASLASAEVVVGGPSTTLMEAIGEARRVFIWDDEAGRFQYPENIFERFSTARDLYDRLCAPADPSIDVPAADDVWARDWQVRYKEFLQPFIEGTTKASAG